MSSELKCTHLSVDDGLSQSTVWTILQDSQGFLWFGTADGLDRYDGHSFKIFQHDEGDSKSLIDNFLNCVAEDPQGRIWIGTDAGLCCYDKQTDAFKRVSDSLDREFQLSSRQIVRLLMDRSGTLWIGTPNGITLLDPAQRPSTAAQLVLPYAVLHLRTQAIFEDSNGNVWISAGDSLFRFERATMRMQVIPVLVKHSTITSIFQDRTGTMWFGTVNSELLSVDAITSQWDRFAYSPKGYRSLTENFLSSIVEDKYGRLWVGTRLGGLSTFDRSTHTWQRFVPKAEGQRFEGTNALLLDRSGLLWVGYDGAGIVKINPAPPKFHHLLLPSTANNVTGDNFLKPVLEDQLGELWIGRFDKGLAVLNRSTGRLRHYVNSKNDPTSLSSNAVVALLEDRDGHVWVGTEEGVDLYNRTTNGFKRYPTGDAWEDNIAKTASPRMPRGSEVRSFSQDSTGTIWVGTAKRLLKFDVPTQKFSEVNIEAPKSREPFRTWVESITSSRDGTLWLGTDMTGLLHIDPQGTLLGQFSHNVPNTLCHNTVKCIYIHDDGALWIGTVEGLNRFNPTSEEWLQYREKDGLPDGTIYGILPAGENVLWLSTNRGLSRMDITDPHHPKFRNYTPDDGLQSYEFNTKTYFKTRSGEMLFGGINGLNTFFPDSITDNPNIPQVGLTEFKEFDQPRSLGQSTEIVNAITLGYGESVFSFEFAALEYTNPHRNQYAYMMEGFENQWIYCGTKREARYTNLSSGTYTFKVKGSNDDGIWNEAGIAIKVTIVPPFWQRFWFLTLLGLAVAGTIGAIVRAISVRKLRREIDALERQRALELERQATRDRIARDLHDDVSSTLSSMSLFVESSQARLKDAGIDATLVLNKLRNLARNAEDAMEQAVWSLSSQHDKLSDLVARIRDVASEECFDNDIKCEVTVSDSGEDFLLDEPVRKNIYLIFKESLANTVKHAQASTLRVTLGSEGEIFRLLIQDDGKGFVPELPCVKPRGGNGLKNMEGRASDIGAVLKIQSQLGAGTVVAVEMQIAHMRH